MPAYAAVTQTTQAKPPAHLPVDYPAFRGLDFFLAAVADHTSCAACQLVTAQPAAYRQRSRALVAQDTYQTTWQPSTLSTTPAAMRTAATVTPRRAGATRCFRSTRGQHCTAVRVMNRFGGGGALFGAAYVSRSAIGCPPRPDPSLAGRALPLKGLWVCAAGVMDRPADSGVDISKRAGWDSDRDSNLATLPRPDTGTPAVA